MITSINPNNGVPFLTERSVLTLPVSSQTSAFPLLFVLQEDILFTLFPGDYIPPILNIIKNITINGNIISYYSF
jgi:hypothetical protein